MDTITNTPAPFPSATKKWHSQAYASISPARPELSAKGKSVLITGGGSGIGAATALAFAEAGAARIAVLGRTEKSLLDTQATIRKAHPSADVVSIPTDITKAASIDDAFARFAAGSTNGKIDVIVSGAAAMGDKRGIADCDPDAVMEGIETNVRGSLHVAKAVVKYGAPKAVVVDINSAVLHLNVMPGFVSYNSSKAAVWRLWDSLSVEKPELQIFHLQPGVIDSAMSREAGGVENLGIEDKGTIQESKESHPRRE